MDLVIFDCDGVLVDSERIAIRANMEVSAGFGWHLTEEQVIERFVGKAMASITKLVAQEIGEANAREWAEQFRELYLSTLDAEVAPVDGIVEALDEIDISSCVASSGSHEKLRLVLGRTGLYSRFEGRIFSAGDVANGKPAPDLFLHAAARMGVEPGRCVVVEDSQYGVQAARAAGMRSFAYTGGVTPAAWLEGPETVLFDDMRQLPHLLRAQAEASAGNWG